MSILLESVADEEDKQWLMATPSICFANDEAEVWLSGMSYTAYCYCTSAGQQYSKV